MARIKIQRSFGAVPNNLLNNPEISFKAKGLFAYLNSKPEDWDFSIQSISVQNKEGKDSIAAAIKELEAMGYLLRRKYQDSLGQFHIEYILSETPFSENPVTENPVTENTDDGKHPKQYKKELTKKENTTKKEDNTGNMDFGPWSEAMRVWIGYK